MTTSYPSVIDSRTSLPLAIDNITNANANAVNLLRSAIIAIETELGTKPSGTYSTVKDRLDIIDSIISEIRTVTFAGDISGTDNSQTVIAINGSFVPPGGTLTIGNVLNVTGTSMLRYSALNLAGGDNYVIGILPVANQEVQTMSGDVSGTTTSATVVSLTGSSNIITANCSTLSWPKTIIAPTIKQVDNTISSATATSLTIQAQNATSTTSVGGNLILTSGTGTSTNGSVLIQAGGSTKITVSTSSVSIGTNFYIPAFSAAGIIHNDATGLFSSSTIVNSDISASAAIAVSKLAAGNDGQILINNGTPTPTWTTITGDVLISNSGSTTVISLTGTAGSIIIANTGNILTWDKATTAPGLKQADNTDPSGAGATMTIQAQNATGTTSTGGALYIKSGTGTSSNGTVYLLSGGSSIMSIATAGVYISAFNVAGVVHNDTNGLLSSSLIVDSDISGTISVSKLAAGSSAQVLITNGTTPTWTTISSDATISNTGHITVQGIQGKTLASSLASIGAGQNGYVLAWKNSNSDWEALPTVGTILLTSIAGSTANNDVAIITSSITSTAAKIVTLTGTPGAFSISGFTNGYDGMLLDLYNFTGYKMTIKNETGSSASNQIYIPTNADLILTPVASGYNTVSFRYSTTYNKWLIVGYI